MLSVHSANCHLHFEHQVCSVARISLDQCLMDQSHCHCLVGLSMLYKVHWFYECFYDVLQMTC